MSSVYFLVLHVGNAGSPALADEVVSLLKDAGVTCKKEAKRGLDHGVFLPIMSMYPKADVPVVSLSLQSSRDPVYVWPCVLVC